MNLYATHTCMLKTSDESRCKKGVSGPAESAYFPCKFDMISERTDKEVFAGLLSSAISGEKRLKKKHDQILDILGPLIRQCRIGFSGLVI